MAAHVGSTCKCACKQHRIDQRVTGIKAAEGGTYRPREWRRHAEQKRRAQEKRERGPRCEGEAYTVASRVFAEGLTCGWLGSAGPAADASSALSPAAPATGVEQRCPVGNHALLSSGGLSRARTAHREREQVCRCASPPAGPQKDNTASYAVSAWHTASCMTSHQAYLPSHSANAVQSRLLARDTLAGGRAAGSAPGTHTDRQRRKRAKVGSQLSQIQSILHFPISLQHSISCSAPFHAAPHRASSRRQSFGAHRPVPA